MTFFNQWHEAALTSLGFFWMALWAFSLGYLISSLIQVLVTRRRMQRMMGKRGPKSMALGTFFGFISSSCSFAALSTTRALFQKGAGLAPALAFLLASTNLVIELGIVIALFLGWQFVVGEYVGGVILILFAWLFVRLFYPKNLIKQARQRLDSEHGEATKEKEDWRVKVASLEGWREIAKTYVMEWNMVWKDVLIGFTVAGIISAFVPNEFFATLFIGSGTIDPNGPGLWAILSQTLVGPIVAFFTFIGSMGNIPLAALLFGHGVSFAGVMAFIFSDLVVFPVLRINSMYYGWKMAFYILALLLIGLVFTSLLIHYGLAAFDLLPMAGQGQTPAERDFFALNYGFYLNLLFLGISVALGWLFWSESGDDSHSEHHDHGNNTTSLTDVVLRTFSISAILWLASGILIPLFVVLPV